MVPTPDRMNGALPSHDRRRLAGVPGDAAQVDPEATALRVGDGAWRWSELAELSERRAARLRRQGLQAGDVVLCPTTPVLDSMLMQQALARLGAAVLPVRHGLSAARRDLLIKTSGAEWIWAPADRQLETHGQLLRTGARGGADPVEQDDDSPFVLVETSGSSARPKLAMLSATNVAASCVKVNERLAVGPGDAWLCVLPRQHVGGLAIGYRCALAGAAMIVRERFDPATVLCALDEHGVTHLSLVPAMLQRLLDQGRPPPPGLRVVLLGGQALDPSLARRGVGAGWPLYLGYGMTETFSQIAGAWIDEAGTVLGGLEPLDGVQVEAPRCAETRPEHEQASETAPEQAPQRAPKGRSTHDQADASPAMQTASHQSDMPSSPLQRPNEHRYRTEQIAPLRVRGPMLMLGYANPLRSAGTGLTDGWLETGDLACQQHAGGLTILGRADDVIISGGVNVLPAEVEQRLAAFEGVAEVAVVGLPDPAWGQRLVAVYAGSCDPAGIEQWARAALPSQLRPRGFVRLAELPRLASGKRDRHAIERQAAALDSASGV
ncbi:MAG: AMP-binding protein [Gammaproteobacteria bacterium]|nr:AMP-binding protein [Gammaproteobacteria bacterium]